ncbi:dihydrolipoyl dehydrogenase [Desulfopila aestuarii]|uniref:Dihydrolipoyl dehydrogenase n=1 Tax=Desulfopila aestuarii DSM 18488 TaxID=1121416 RepID=A0A1M7Y5G4_9BACT|nr:dihydrolipoyl dehydrogenase [Desulfopila aestuarii]SHO47764.1 dihydrolipoamide dehydrogenase [Desulfopila aestuarii DSM 18488]
MVMGDMEMTVDLAIIGSGPGGYGAAFRAADLGLDVALIDPRHRPGGVCLHEGCIPSKTFLFLAEMILNARRVEKMGLHFGTPRIDIAAMAAWKGEVIDNMAGGLVHLCQQRGIQLIRGISHFENATTLRLEDSELSRLKFKNAIIATGSTPITFPGTRSTTSSRIMRSAEALSLADVPHNLLIVGGGYVGLELGTVYAALGSNVQLAELQERLLPAVDPDLVAPLHRSLTELFEQIHLATAIKRMEETADHVQVTLATPNGEQEQRFDKVLVAMGRTPATTNLGLANTQVEMNDKGFIVVDEQQRTAEPNIFAVGDVVGGMMLAHTATREGRIAAEVIAGQSSTFDARAIPAVIYTDPQIAWCGLTEQQAVKENIHITVLKYPWKYSGRANTMGATDGLTKILADPESGRILGIGITGRETEGMIAEGVLAIEMGALAEDMALSLHPHPTLSETEGEAAEIFLGSPTHLLPKQKR